MNKNIITIIVSIATLVSLVVGGLIGLDTRYANAIWVNTIEKRLNYKIESDKLTTMQQRAWQIQDRYPDMGKAPQEIKQQYRELENDLNIQKEKVKTLEK